MNQQASTFLLLLFGALLLIASANATSLEPIWISPKNVNYTYDSDVLETFPVDKGVWTKLDIGSGPRGNTPGVVMDSKGILWLMFGAKDDFGSNFWHSVWNYNPKTDQFRYVWRSNETSPRNAGELRVPAETNHPGSILSGGITIDNNDNIWLTSFQYLGEFWMFNTTSWMFTRMQGLSGTESEMPSIGANPGQPGEDVWPGRYVAQCLLTDSQNNIWLLSGNNYNGISNSVWYFNTTSLLWTYITGTIVQIGIKHNSTFYSGTIDPGCFMDDNDRAWLYGGYGPGDDDYGHIWTFDTRTKREWEFEYGADPYQALPNVASDDFHPDNRPSAAEGSILVDRMDGTVMLVTGYGFNDQGVYGGTDTVWLYSKSLKQWKLFSGNISAIDSEGVYVNYRQPGNRFPSIRYSGKPNGKNCDGDVYVVGSLNVDIGYNRKDIWLIPQDQCTVGNHKCDVNADCIEEMVGYSCECKQGYTGDGFTCTAPPTNPIALPVNAPKQQTSGASVVVSSLLVIVVALL